MFFNHRTIRWPVTASLILSFGVAALCPPPVEAAPSGTHVESQTPACQCCCCKKGGRCCGKCDMPCCAIRKVPAKEQTPRPSNDENRGWRTNLLACVGAKAPFACNETVNGSQFGTADSNANRSLADSTLQTRHVRLDA